MNIWQNKSELITLCFRRRQVSLHFSVTQCVFTCRSRHFSLSLSLSICLSISLSPSPSLSIYLSLSVSSSLSLCLPLVLPRSLSLALFLCLSCVCSPSLSIFFSLNICSDKFVSVSWKIKTGIARSTAELFLRKTNKKIHGWSLFANAAETIKKIGHEHIFSILSNKFH